ncbi:ABC transporter substrate-binding protein [Cohnella hashimotonis]|uniref:Extracellular solute-binding protein n=1 Tax=Cohnella hashimotonis TaxID=2826895 RepID=A0ABT6TLY2_9BACL|nr:extracellular solute-binding protein [Cohnella hashimotonis]MDI4647320.1 extracellular solute-binding protein [Cohnella hashimotonis]
MRISKVFLVLCIVLVFLVSCTSKENKIFEEKKTYELKVLYWDSESFFSTYGNYINSEFPNIEFEVIPLKQIYVSDIPPKEEINKLVSDENPDIMILNQGQYDFLESKLEPLKSIISKETFSSLQKGVKELLESYGEGDVYGIPMSFTTNLMFYNKDILDSFNIDPQTFNQMDWIQFFQMIRKIPPAEDQLAFYAQSSEPASLITSIGISEGYSYLDQNSSKINLNTEGWKSIIEAIKPLYNDHLINSWDSSYGFDKNPFIQGSAATMIGDYNLFRSLTENSPSFTWGVAPLPSKDHSRASMNLEKIITINKESGNKNAAIKFIEYLMSEKMTKILGNIDTSLSSSMYSSVSKNESNPIHFIYDLSANLDSISSYKKIEAMPEEFNNSFSPFFVDIIRQIINNEIDINVGLNKLEEFGNNLLGAN